MSRRAKMLAMLPASLKKKVGRGTKKDQSQDRRIRKIERELSNEMFEGGEGTNVNNVLSTTPIIRLLTGDPGASVEGFKYKLKSVRIRGWVKQNLASAVTDMVRVDLVLAKHLDGTIPTITDIYGAATPGINRFRDFDAKETYKILRTYMFGFEGTTNVVETFDSYHKLNLIVKSDTDGSFGEADVYGNMVYIVAWTDAGANVPTWLMNYSVITQDIS